jgi:hypothetical protein
MVNDDCESSASFATAEQKTATCIKSSMLRNKIISDGDVEVHTISRDKEFDEKLKYLIDKDPKSPTLKSDLELVKFMTGGTSKDDVFTFMAVANILRQFDLTMDLCIGTANAAAVGAAAQLSGHCYAICRGIHHPTGSPVQMIVEGTRWVTQDSYKPKKKRVLDIKTGNLLNEIATILMEMTKLPDMDILLDAGTALMRVIRSNKEAFYKNVYVCGDSIKIRRNRKDKTVIIGASVVAILGAHGNEDDEDANDEPEVEDLPVRYNLACNRIQEKSGVKIPPSAVGKAVRDMARETIVPPWTKGHWESIMKDFNEFEELYFDHESTKIKPEDINRDVEVDLALPKNCKTRGPKRIRFVFVHQLYSRMTKETRDKFEEIIKECINGVGETKKESKVPVTKNHRDRLLRNLVTEKELKESNDKAKAELALELMNFNEERAMQSLKGFPGKVRIERIFLSMNSLVTVCNIHPEDIATVHSMLGGWIKEIVDAQKMIMSKPSTVAAAADSTTEDHKSSK